jgi:hypothetical protein
MRRFVAPLDVGVALALFAAVVMTYMLLSSTRIYG